MKKSRAVIVLILAIAAIVGMGYIAWFGIGGGKTGSTAYQWNDVVDSATEIERGFGCPVEETATAVSVEVEFEEVVRHAEAEEQDVALAVGESETSGKRIKALLDAARRRWRNVLHGLGETRHGRADAIADLGKRTAPDLAKEGDRFLVELNLERPALEDGAAD